jgi:hypothetical protein
VLDVLDSSAGDPVEPVGGRRGDRHPGRHQHTPGAAAVPVPFHA